jgi:hypothetical protein
MHEASKLKKHHTRLLTFFIREGIPIEKNHSKVGLLVAINKSVNSKPLLRAFPP